MEPTPVIDPSNALSPSQRMALIQQIIWGFYNEMETEVSCRSRISRQLDSCFLLSQGTSKA